MIQSGQFTVQSTAWEVWIEPYTGRPPAPYPFMVWINHARMKVYLANLASYLELLEQHAPVISAALLAADREEAEERAYQKARKKWRRQHQKRKKEEKKKRRKAKAVNLPPTG